MPLYSGNRKSKVHPGLPRQGRARISRVPPPTGVSHPPSGRKLTRGVRPSSGTNGRRGSGGAASEPRYASVRDSPQTRAASVGQRHGGRLEGPTGPAFPCPPGTAHLRGTAVARLRLHEPGRGRPSLSRPQRGDPDVLVLAVAVAGVRHSVVGNVDARGAAHPGGGGTADTLAGSRDPVSKRPARRLGAAAGAVSSRPELAGGGGERGSRVRKRGRPFYRAAGAAAAAVGRGRWGGRRAADAPPNMPFLRREPPPSPSHRRARRGRRASGECRGRRFALSPPGAAGPRRVCTAALASSDSRGNGRSPGGARFSARRAAG